MKTAIASNAASFLTGAALVGSIALQGLSVADKQAEKIEITGGFPQERTLKEWSTPLPEERTVYDFRGTSVQIHSIGNLLDSVVINDSKKLISVKYKQGAFHVTEYGTGR